MADKDKNDAGGKEWHAMEPEEVMRGLRSRSGGLTREEAASRLAEYGPNELGKTRSTPGIIIFLRQFTSPLVYILLAAALVKFAVGNFLDGGVIVAVLLLMAVIGFIQEIRARKAMEALQRMAADKATVRREGEAEHVPSEELVPGDIVLLEAGDSVPADGRLIETINLTVDEAALTGESVPVNKDTRRIDQDVQLAERRNMVYLSTTVVDGRGAVVITQTGTSTQMGAIAEAIREIKAEPTPLQASIDRISYYLIWLILGACALLIAIGLYRGLSLVDVFMLAVSAAVAAVPEGLPAAVTVVLAMGMQVMAARNAIVRKLVAVETLGSATVICTDKTGTLTMNEMTVSRVWTGSGSFDVAGEGYRPTGTISEQGRFVEAENDPTLRQTLMAGALCNNARLVEDNGNYRIVGDPTEGALIVLGAKAGLRKEELDERYPRLAEIPFQSERRFMATLHGTDDRRVLYVKGSVEKVLGFCRDMLTGDRVRNLDETARGRVMQAAKDMAKDALRVIATAYAEWSAVADELTDDALVGRLTFAGFVAMIDPPREEARHAIDTCRKAGIKVVMITGDSALTAQAIARQLDFEEVNAVTGADLRHMSDGQLGERIERVSVFARTEPLDKLRIVNAFKSRGHVVAMTGDGVNDAAALETADIGVAMGITGTDAAREASDMVLADDNFVSVVAAVEEGRAIFNRLRYVLLFLFTTGLGELMILIASVAIVGAAPLEPLQILWINLVTGALMTLPLASEPRTGDELSHPPRSPRVGLLYPGLLQRVVFLSVFLAIPGVALFYHENLRMGPEHARTMVFCSVVIFEWLLALNARSDEYSVFRLGFFRNRWLLSALALGVSLQLLVIYIPVLMRVFQVSPLSPGQWALAALPGITVFFIETLRKKYRPKLFSRGKW